MMVITHLLVLMACAPKSRLATMHILQNGERPEEDSACGSARRLFITTKTASNHVANILAKLGAAHHHLV